jgi:hypothetical protein
MGIPLTPAKPQSNGLILWILFLVVLFSVTTALNWHRSLIGTEIWALFYAGRPFAEQIASIRGDLVHPPFFYLLERAWLALFGQTDNVAKALAVVISLPTFVLMTLLARRVTSHWRLLSFFLLSIYLRFGSTPTQVRMYGFAILLVVVALLLWDNWRTDPRTSTLLAWTGVALLLTYSHLFGSLVVCGFVLANWLFGRRKWIFTAAAAVCGLLFLPWVLYVIPIYRTRGLEPNLTWVHRNLISAVADFLGQLLGVVELPASLSRFRIPALVALAVHLLLLLLAWKFRARLWPLRGDNENQRHWFWSSAVITAVPVAILLAFSVVVARAFEARFVLGVLPAYWLAVFLLCQLSGRAGWVLLLGVLLPWKLLSVGTGLYANWQPDWPRQATSAVAQQVRPADLLLTADTDSGNLIYWEWTRRLQRDARLETLPTLGLNAANLSVLNPVELEKLRLDGVSRIWLFYQRSDTRDPIVRFLATRGFAPRPDALPGVPSVLLLVRSGSN